MVRRPTTGTVRRREVRGLGLPVGVDVLEVAEGRDRPHPLDGLPLDVLAMLICPVESRRPGRIISVTAVKGPGVAAVMK